MDTAPNQIGDFYLSTPIANRSDAVVYRAHQQSLDRETVVKVISCNAENTIVLLENARRQAALEHLHIVPIYSYGQISQAVYIAMRLMRGGSLADAMAVRREFSALEIGRWHMQTRSALQYAHLRGFTHGRIKPTNILFDEHNNAYLADFSLSAQTYASIAADFEALDSLFKRIGLTQQAQMTASRITQTAPVRRAPRPNERFKRRVMRAGVVLALIAITALLFDLVPGFFALSLEPPTILAGETGTPEDVIPSRLEILRAQARVTENSGFIAYIACSTENETQAARIRELTEMTAAYQVPFHAYDGLLNEYRFITQFERALAEGAAAILVCPLTFELDESVARARAAGVAVINLGIESGAEGTINVGIDATELGRSAAAHAAQISAEEYGGRARIAVLGIGALDAESGRTRGIFDGLAAYAPLAEVTGLFPGDTREIARASVESMIRNGRLPDLLVCYADVATYGAIEALQAAHIPPDQVQIVSINAESFALSYLRHRVYLRATLSMNRTAGSQAAVDAAIRMLGGGTLPETVIVPPGAIIAHVD